MSAERDDDVRRQGHQHAVVIANADETIAPYVGEGEDGCRRSAQIVRDEVATLDVADPRLPGLLAQAEAWDRRAMHERAVAAR
jgi:hypothetical protein